MEKTPREGGNITILVLGDEGVGKSSLVSTYISRHFSEIVPPIITRVRIPPDPNLANCTSTIIDTQEADAALSDAPSLSGIRLGSRGSLASATSADSISSWGKEDATASSKTPVALLSTTSPYKNISAIILVYDVDRSETFDRLSSHWLPLIEKCYGGIPVIIAGNKMDLQSTSVNDTNENQSIRSRQEIITLLQRFMFVRQCIKCSARNLLNIDEVFRKAQQAVLYPITPLYDLNTGRLTNACFRALSRIFRIFDVDRDGFLSDEELNAFQANVWGVMLMERDVSSWKKVVVEHNAFCHFGEEDEQGHVGAAEERVVSPVLRDGKFTLRGFLTIFDVFISQNRLEVPWKVLRSFGHDDDELNLMVPPSMAEGDDFINVIASDWRLSTEEESFLANLFHQYDSDKDGILASNETRSLFSVLSKPLAPWSNDRGKSLFSGCPSVPRIENDGTSPSPSMLGVPFDEGLEMSPLPSSSAPESSPDSPSLLSASGLTISSSPLPSVDISKDTTPPLEKALGSRPISFLSWINHWHMMCTISPSICRIELYRLGYLYDNTVSQKQGRPSSAHHQKVKKIVPKAINSPTLFVRALVIGNKESGSISLIRKLHGTKDVIDATMPSLDCPETSCSVSKILWPTKSSKGDTKVETILHLIFTHISFDKNKNDSNDSHIKLAHLLESGVYDMALLVYNSPKSFDAVKKFEADVLNEKMPRLFVCATTDSSPSDMSQLANNHCKELKLDPPCNVDVDKPQSDLSFTELLVRYAQRPRHSTSKRRKLLWLGGLVAVGVTVVIGLTIGRKKRSGSDKSWFKCLLDLVSY